MPLFISVSHTYFDHAQDLALRPATSASTTSGTQSRRPKTGSKEFLRRLQADLDSRETRLQVVVLQMTLRLRTSNLGSCDAQFVMQRTVVSRVVGSSPM